MSICNRNRIMTGLRFLFRVTLRRLDLVAEIYREPQKVPLAMSPDETKRLLAVSQQDRGHARKKEDVPESDAPEAVPRDGPQKEKAGGFSCRVPEVRQQRNSASYNPSRAIDQPRLMPSALR